MAMLRILNELPSGLLDADATEVRALLGGPTLIHLEGRRGPALFVSVLLHGNETTGFEAIKQVLKRYRPGGGAYDLPRALSLFIGNVDAAEKGVRRLKGQPDYNRVWPGTPEPDSPEKTMMAEVVAEVTKEELFASIDVHNTTGVNPQYACIRRLDGRSLHLASVYSRTIVYFRIPHGVQTAAFADICPAVTLECGQVSDPTSLPHTVAFLDGCLHLSLFPEHMVPDHDYEVFHTVARVSLPDGASFGFNGEATDIRFRDDLDHLNFNELPLGTELARLGDGISGLVVTDENDERVEGRYFRLDGDRLVTSMPVMPSMLTLNAEVVRQDCLGYLMERYPRKAWPKV